jgi:hypothetical protein
LTKQPLRDWIHSDSIQFVTNKSLLRPRATQRGGKKKTNTNTLVRSRQEPLSAMEHNSMSSGSGPPVPRWEDAPADVFVHIARHLDPVSIVALCSTCSSNNLRSGCNSPLLWLDLQKKFNITTEDQNLLRREVCCAAMARYNAEKVLAPRPFSNSICRFSLLLSFLINFFLFALFRLKLTVMPSHWLGFIQDRVRVHCGAT